MGYFYELKYEFSVPPTVFSPPPKVMSAVFSMKRKNIENQVPFSILKKVVKASFSQRRKTLRNAVKGLEFSDFPEKEKWFSMRAEQLSVSDFVKLASHLV
jgi:16S rRNA (adenine1518-N6/adenine1519-N6)-dimethyltransferase